MIVIRLTPHGELDPDVLRRRDRERAGLECGGAAVERVERRGARRRTVPRRPRYPVRLRDDGALDRSFVSDVFAAANGRPGADGRLVVARKVPEHGSCAVARLDPDGALDPLFGAREFVLGELRRRRPRRATVRRWSRRADDGDLSVRRLLGGGAIPPARAVLKDFSYTTVRRGRRGRAGGAGHVRSRSGVAAGRHLPAHPGRHRAGGRGLSRSPTTYHHPGGPDARDGAGHRARRHRRRGQRDDPAGGDGDDAEPARPRLRGERVREPHRRSRRRRPGAHAHRDPTPRADRHARPHRHARDRDRTASPGATATATATATPGPTATASPGPTATATTTASASPGPRATASPLPGVATPTPTASPRPDYAAALKALRLPRLTARGGAVTFTVKPVGTTLTVTLRSRGRKPVVYGRGSGTRRITVRLNAAGRKAARRTLKVDVVLSAGGARRTVAATIRAR